MEIWNERKNIGDIELRLTWTIALWPIPYKQFFTRFTATAQSPGRCAQPMSSFNDISLYAKTPFSVGDPEYHEDVALTNFVSDLYIRNMGGYKPPNTTRVSIQAGPKKMWDRTWKDGSLRLVSAIFEYDHFSSLDKFGRYRYVLDIIQECMLKLSIDFSWEQAVFVRAYNSVIASGFRFEIFFPSKIARNKQAKASICLRKNESLAQILVNFYAAHGNFEVVLVEKKNWWWYDSTYMMVKNYKWFDNERFGVDLKKLGLKFWYDISRGCIFYEYDNTVTTEFNLQSVLKF
jgi:hypothetical protein